MTIDNLISWLQEAEDNNTWLVSTQSVKRHLEKIKKTEQLTIPAVVGRSEQLPQKSEYCVSISPEPCKYKGVCKICS